MKSYVFVFCASLLFCLACQQVDGQECKDCQVRSIRFGKPSVVRTYEVVEMQTQMQWQQVQVEVPVTRKFEEIKYTREVFDGGVSRLRSRPRRLRAFNWGCVATAVGAYFNCATAKRGDRIGLLRRIFNRR